MPAAVEQRVKELLASGKLEAEYGKEKAPSIAWALATKQIEEEEKKKAKSDSCVRRYDFLGADSLRPAHMTDEGFLFVDGIATRTGVFEYEESDGSVRRELRDASEVMTAESLASLGRKPVTLQHPPEHVSPTNAARYVAGSVGETIEQADGFVRVTLAIHRADAIRAIQAGTQQLSCGYSAEYIAEPGVTADGQRYDGRQINIRYNHLALVDVGRAGPQARIRLDARGNAVYDTDVTEGRPMAGKASIEIRGVRFDEMDPALAGMIQEMKDLCSKYEGAATEAKAEAVDAQAKADAAAGALAVAKAELETARKDAVEGFPARFRVRHQLLGLATQYRVDGADSMADAELRRAILKAAHPGLRLDAASDEYVMGAIATLPAVQAQAVAHVDALAIGVQNAAQSGGDLHSRLDAARKVNIARLTGAPAGGN